LSDTFPIAGNIPAGDILSAWPLILYHSVYWRCMVLDNSYVIPTIYDFIKYKCTNNMGANWLISSIVTEFTMHELNKFINVMPFGSNYRQVAALMAQSCSIYLFQINYLLNYEGIKDGKKDNCFYSPHCMVSLLTISRYAAGLSS